MLLLLERENLPQYHESFVAAEFDGLKIKAGFNKEVSEALGVDRCNFVRIRAALVNAEEAFNNTTKSLSNASCSSKRYWFYSNGITFVFFPACASSSPSATPNSRFASCSMSSKFNN